MRKKVWKRSIASALAVCMVSASLMPFQTSAREMAAKGLTYQVNHSLGSSATANEEEREYWGADKAVDGIVNRDAQKEEQSRWSTNRDVNIGPKVLTVDLGETQSFDSFVLEWERNNITGFRIEVSDDGEEYRPVYIKDDGVQISSLTTTVELDKKESGRYVRLTVDGYNGGDGNWESVSLYEFKILEEKSGENLALNAVASADGYESGTAYTPDKANDGKRMDADKQSRWASTKEQGEKWLQLKFDEETKIGTVILEWERRNATDYKIQISDDGVEWKDVKAFTKAPSEKVQTIVFDEVETAQYVRLYINDFEPDSEGVDWETVSVYEFEVYEDRIDIENEKTLEEIAAELEVPAVEKGQETFALPEVPSDVEIELIGADYEQIIDRDLTIHEPLVDSEVEVNFRLKRGEEELETDAFSVLVPGKYEENTGSEKPKVIPELAEWAGRDGNFEISETSRIVVNENDKDALSYMAEEFKNDYKDVVGKEIEIVYGTEDDVKAHDFYFTLGSSDAGLKEEGYYMDINDSLKCEALDKQGAYWATRSILQILKQTGNTISKGEVRDYPKYELRGFMLDVARKPISRETINSILKEMAWYKLNDFQIHLNDNSFVNEYDTEEKAMKGYSGFRLESDVKQGGNNGLNQADLTSKDLFYTKDEFRNLIENARKKGIEIVPEFDTPAHSLAFTKVRPDLRFNATPKGCDHLNLHEKYDETFEFITSIWDEYLEGENPVFDEETTVNIGTDEYDGTYAEQFRQYTDDMLSYVQDTGRSVRLWGSLSQRDGQTPVRSEDVQMNIWNTNWAVPKDMYEAGYDMINMEDSVLYIVPGAEYYHDYLDAKYLYENWEANKIGNTVIPAGSDQMLGASFALWNDKVDMHANGLTETDVYDRFASALPAMSSKLWGEGEDLSYEKMEETADLIGEAPNDNPYMEETADTDNKYMEYTFEDGKETEDSSENNRDLTKTEGVSFKNEELVLSQDTSYVESPMKKLGMGNVLSFDITLTEQPKAGQILFEEDSEYGTHDIRILEDNTLGFTREGYVYSFGYTLPVGEKVHLDIETSQDKTTLYVDGEEYHAIGQYILNGEVKKDQITNSGFSLPLQRIGSDEKAVRAHLDNIQVSKGEYENPYLMDSSKFEVKADSEQSGNEITKAFDKNESTFWHSSWNPYVALPAEIVIDMNETAMINRLTYLPRQDNNNNGQIKKYSIYVSKTGEDNDWIPVVEEGTWAADATWKTATFEPVEARYVKFVAEEGTGDKTGNTFACAAEINLYRSDVEKPEEPTEGISTAVLEYALSLTENVDTEGVIESVVERYNAALENAKDILKRVQDGDTSVTQEMVDNAWKELINAMQYMSFKQGDKTDLSKVIALAEEMNNNLSSYLDEGKEAFVEAFENAKAVLEDGDAMQEEVDSAWKGLLNAMAGLQKIPDKGALEELLNKSETLNAEDYETESFAVFETAFAEAKAVYEDGQATEVQVNEAVEKLEGAIAKLIPAKETEDGTVANAGKEMTSSGNKETNVSNTANVKKETATKSAKTGDEGNAALPAAGILAAVAAAFVWKRRR